MKFLKISLSVLLLSLATLAQANEIKASSPSAAIQLWVSSSSGGTIDFQGELAKDVYENKLGTIAEKPVSTEGDPNAKSFIRSTRHDGGLFRCWKQTQLKGRAIIPQYNCQMMVF